MQPQKLDRKRSYGTVYGDPNVGFIQDELPYRHDGTLQPNTAVSATPPPAATVPTAASFPTASEIPTPEVIRALAELSSQIKELKPEALKPPDPARSEKMRQVWVERRAREAAANSEPRA